MSAIPWVGHDIVELKDVVECTLPTIGTISKHAFKNGRKERLDKKEFLSIPYSFLAMIVGFIDGDGYISITKSTKGFITLNITISLHIKDLSALQYIQTVLGLGRINLYPKSGKQDTCKLVINKTDLQEVLFPLFIYHKLFFFTNTRREQYDKAIYILQNDIKLFSNIPTVVPSVYPIFSTVPDYTNLPFFNNWIVGFTECKEFAGYVEYKKKISITLMF
jgi:hypothetical protein